MAVTVGQKKSIAVKLATEFSDFNRKEIETYYDSDKYKSDLKEFETNHPKASMIKSAIDLIKTMPDFVISIRLKFPGESYWGSRMDIEKPDNNDYEDYYQKILDEAFRKSIEITPTYTNLSSDSLYYQVEYLSLTIPNIKDIEDKVREDNTRPFKVCFKN